MLADTQLLEKIDLLQAEIHAQSQKLEALSEQNRLLRDMLSKIDEIVPYLEEQRQRQAEWEELKRDLIPIGNQMIKLSIDELAEIGNDFELRDLLYLLKRLLRDIPLILSLLDRLEAAVELLDEVQRLTKPAFNQAVHKLDELERAGYFKFARESGKILHRVVTEFTEEDVKALGDNIVTILTTVKNLTQPEMMALTNQAITAIRDDSEAETKGSYLSLLKDLSDPKVKRGLAKLINLVKALSDSPQISTKEGA